MNYLGLDLNGERRFCDPAKYDFAGMIDERRPAGVRATDATSSVDHVSPLREPLCGRTEGEVVLLPRSVPVHGVRAVYLPGELARHRSVPARPAVQALSPGDPFGGSTQRARQRQSRSRLADLSSSIWRLRALYRDAGPLLQVREQRSAEARTAAELAKRFDFGRHILPPRLRIEESSANSPSAATSLRAPLFRRKVAS